jgi:alkylated DNA repair dioxygenase AlkB
MFLQGSLFGLLEPSFDRSFEAVARHALDATSWVEFVPGWLQGADAVFDQLHRELPWRQRRNVQMYDRLVDEPRLTWWWGVDHDRSEPLALLTDMRSTLSARYGRPFDSIGFNLYRDGTDSVAWHGDRHRHTVTDPVVAIVSVGAARPFRLRPNGGGRSLSWDLGHGDLLVMGGACQHHWQHTVPKTSGAAGPRISITFRHGAA